MKIQGKITWVGQMRKGVSQRSGSEWKSQDIEIEYGSGEYPEQVIATAVNSHDVGLYKPGMGIECEIYHHTREWNGRKFNEIRLRNAIVTPVAGQYYRQPAQQPQPRTEQAPAQPEQPQTYNDDLPF